MLGLFEALTGAQSELLLNIRDICRPENVNPTTKLIQQVINDDVSFQRTPLDLRNQRTYAVRVCHFATYICVYANVEIVRGQWIA